MVDPAPTQPGWTRTQRLLMAAVAGCVVVAMALLSASLASIRSLEVELRRAEDTSEQFVAAMREATRIELELVRDPRTDAAVVVERAALMDRHVDVLLTRQAKLPLEPAQEERVATIATMRDDLLAALGSGDAAAAAAVAGRLEQVAKGAADAADTTRRERLLEQVASTRAASAILIGAMGLVVVGVAVLLASVRRRELRSYQEAVAVANERADLLTRSNAELRAANDTKQRFLSMVSHELRTPLTLVRGFAETLQAHGAGLADDERDHLVGGIVRHAVRQQRIVDDLLTLARHADHAPVAEPRALDAADVIPRAVADAAGDGAAVAVLPGPRCMVWVDHGHLEQVLENLVTNARKYGGPTIEVSWAAGTETVLLVVEDDGPGVPDHFVPDLFLPFSQADDGDMRLSTGVGLGLTVTELLVEANGGRITYRHRDGGGARFEVMLPRATPAQVDEVAPDRRRDDHGPASRRDDGAEARRADDVPGSASRTPRPVAQPAP